MMEKNDLISMKALLKDLSYCAPELWQDEEYIKAKIMKQHTIPAISVEWLKDKMQKPQMTDGNPFGFVLAEWLEEQEAR